MTRYQRLQACGIPGSFSKTAAEDRYSKDDVLRTGAITGSAALGAGALTGTIQDPINRWLNQQDELMSKQDVHVDSLYKFMKDTGNLSANDAIKETIGEASIRDSDGWGAGVKEGPDGRFTKGTLSTNSGRHNPLSTVLHEAGHMQHGWGSLFGSNAGKKIPFINQGSSFLARATAGSRGRAAGAIAAAGSMHSDEGAVLGTGIAGGIMLPELTTLAEEARANVNAVSLLRRHHTAGRFTDYSPWRYIKSMAPAYATYAHTPATIAGVGLAALGARKLYERHQEKNQTPWEKLQGLYKDLK